MNQQTRAMESIRRLAHKPSNLMLTFVALSLLSLALITFSSGDLYVSRLDYVDATTLIMVALLLLRAVWKLQSAANLETIAIALVGSLSFLYSYEAIYKWSFYLLPWQMPAAELRAFLLQAAVGLIILSGFAQQVFRVGRASLVLLGLFLITWAFWLIVGFPQLWDGQNFYNAVLDLPLNWSMIYVINRLTKFLWFMFYYSLYGG